MHFLELHFDTIRLEKFRKMDHQTINRIFTSNKSNKARGVFEELEQS